MSRDIIVIGGGAAGFFSAIRSAEVNPVNKIIIFEKLPSVLSKVKISGGGRCNVTNIISDPKELIKNYPRGGKQLLNLFYYFGTKETIEWFNQRGIELKSEPDGRVFPVTDNSQTIINCLTNEAKKLNIKVNIGYNINEITKTDSGWEVHGNDKTFLADSLIVTTGSSSRIWEILASIGHKIIEPVPSLFTFNQDKKNKDITDLAGVSVPDAIIHIKEINMHWHGPLLITHWGFSGPAILKLSAFAARELNKLNYNYSILINWLPEFNLEQIRSILINIKKENLSKTVNSFTPIKVPKRLWDRLLSFSEIPGEKKWNDVSKSEINKLSLEIHEGLFTISGKSIFKEEFVTAGGIDLNEVNLKTMESNILKNLYLAGEVLNIDGITGGFNFQAAWSTGYIAGSSQI